MSVISMHGSFVVGPYKGYHGCAEYDAEAKLFHGEVTETKDVITFRGREPLELTSAFAESIDDYLDFCKSRGEKPDKPFSGKFMIRTTPKLHHDVTVAAERDGKSLNQFVIEAIEAAANTQAAKPIVTQYIVDMPDIGDWDITNALGALVTTPYKPKTVSLGGRLTDLSVELPRLKRAAGTV